MSIQTQKVRSGIAWSFIESFGIKIVSTLVFLILAKMLGPTQFGIVAIAYTFIDFGDILVEQGMTATLVQKEKLDKEHLDTAFWINIFLGVILFLLFFAISPVIASIYKQPELVSVLRAAGLIFLIGPSGLVHIALLTRDMNFKPIARGRVVALLVGAVASIGMVFWGFGVWALIFQKLIFIGLSTAYFWFSTKWRPRFSFSMPHFRELFSFSYHMTANNLLTYFGRSSVELMVGYFYGIEIVGIYIFCYKIFQSVIEIANSAINKVMLPLFSSVQNDKEQLTQYLYKTIRSGFLLLLPLLAIILFLVPEAIVYFFTDDWSKSISLLQAIAVGGTIFMIFYYTNSVLISIGKPHLVTRFMFVSAILNVAFIYMFRHLPVLYIGYAFILRSVLLLPLAFFFLRKNLPISIYGVVSNLVNPVCVGGITALSLILANHFVPTLSSGWLEIALQGIIGCVAIAISGYIFFPSVLSPVFNAVNQIFSRLSANKKV